MEVEPTSRTVYRGGLTPQNIVFSFPKGTDFEFGFIEMCSSIFRIWFLAVASCVASISVSQPSVAGDRTLMPGKTDALSSSLLGPLKSEFVTPEHLGLPYDEVFIRNGNGERLRLWSLPVADARQTILFCMGNQGNVSTHLSYASLLTEGGFNVLMFDYQGYGKSSGEASVMSLFSDACCVAEYMISEKQLGPSNIGCFGVSLGSTLAVAVSAKYGFGAVAVEDILLPTKQLDQIARDLPNDFASKLALGTVRNVILPQVDPLITAKKLSCPILIMHGELDRLLPLSGSVELASIITTPKRVWFMEDSGHAPETLEIQDGEYGHQLTTFFREAFVGSLIEPQLTMTAKANGESWQADIKIECSREGCYQIAVTSKLGECHFVRRIVENQTSFALTTPFEPVYVSALLVQNAKRLDDENWEPAATARSQSLKDFRSFEGRWRSECPLNSKIAIFYGVLRPVSFRDPKDLKWLSDNLPDPSNVHPDVRPRYARLAAGAFGELLADEQPTHVQFVAKLLPFMPDRPDQYYQLENAGFQLQLRDERLAGSLILLAKSNYEQGQLEEAKRLLRIAAQVTNQTWPKSEGIEELRLDIDFFQCIGSPYNSTVYSSTVK
ncbi:MAG: prolyl oligopeptidase family serine peptidase [Pirellula sp.]|nr:prolyl oligopeptidase family serine peptidase [Pirellula sp.]